MGSIEREGSRDRDALIRHGHSHSFEGGRIHIPMWDSSDPERAPPPLPLNPGSPSLSTRPNASATIQAAAKALEESARASAGFNDYTTNPMPERSPERSLIKGAHHRRLQSLATGGTSAKDLKSYFDNVRSPERSPERVGRSRTPYGDREDRDYLSSSPIKDTHSRSGTPTPAGRDITRDRPTLPPSRSMTQRTILGENTPPSATMLALKEMPLKEDFDKPPQPPQPPPISTLDLNSPSNALIRSPSAPNPDAFSVHILNITNICTNLQREMSQLSRRSKDNATDLVGLKEATKARDEDIRKMLKELVNSTKDKPSHHSKPSGDHNTYGLSFLGDESKPHVTPPSSGRTFKLPRVASPFSDLERIDSPNPYSIEGAASVAMLEKIIREMSTKDGQERLLGQLSKLLDKASKESSDAVKKVEELVSFIKESSSNGFVPRAAAGGMGGGSGGGGNGHPPTLPEMNFDSGSGPLARTSMSLTRTNSRPGSQEGMSPDASEFVNDDIMSLLRKIKDSIGITGGMLGEMKSQQRDLRGEVLGMARELARKIDEASKPPTRLDTRAIEDGHTPDVARLVQEGLENLKQHLDNVMREKRRESSGTLISRASVDTNEVYDVVKRTLADEDLQKQVAVRGLDKDGILNAVKEAYESYKPEIEIQQFGLEKEEILQCLREGLQEYHSVEEKEEGVSKDQVMEIVQSAMQSFQPPPPINEAAEIREEVLGAVRECLSEFAPSQALTTRGDQEMNIMSGIVAETVKSVLATHGPTAPRELEISREDLFQALQAALEQSGSPFGAYGEKVVVLINSLVDDMKKEFQSYSAANGHDTEQVLDAMKDGMEALRTEIETYVDRAHDVTSKDEIVDTIRTGLDQLRTDVEAFVAAGPQGDAAFKGNEFLEYFKAEFEHLHSEFEAVQGEQMKKELLVALQEGFESLKAARNEDEDGKEEVEEAMKEEFLQLREAIVAESSGHRDEILTNLKESFEALQEKLGAQHADGSQEEVVKTMKDEFEHLRETLATALIKPSGNEEVLDAVRETLATAMVKPDNNEEVINSIRECMEGLRTQLAEQQNQATEETLDKIQADLEQLRETVSGTLVRANEPSDNQEVLDVLREGLESIRSSVASAKPEGEEETEEGKPIDIVRAQLELLRQSLGNQLTNNSNAARADAEEIMDTVRLGLDDMRSDFTKKLDNPEHHMKATGEILDGLNEGLDGLKTDLIAAMDKPVDMSVSYEILETLKEGLMSIRQDLDELKAAQIQHVVHPEMQAEIQTEAPLEEEAEAAAEDGEREIIEEPEIAGDEIVLANPNSENVIHEEEPQAAEPHEEELQAEAGALARTGPQAFADIPDMLRRGDIERMELMLAQLQGKIGMIDEHLSHVTQAPPPPAPESVAPEAEPEAEAEVERELDLEAEIAPEAEAIPIPESVEPTVSVSVPVVDLKPDLDAIVELIKDLQAEVTLLGEKEAATVAGDGLAKKDDTDAIETLLSNTKAKLDEMVLPDPELLPTREQVENVEINLKTASDVIDSLAVAIKDEVASKTDVAVVEVLVQDMKAVIDEIKEKQAAVPEETEDESEKITRKKDLDVLGVICTEIKQKIDDFKLPDPEMQPSKADVDQLKGLLDDFRDSFEKLKDTHETDIAVQAKCFDDRKQEAAEILTVIGALKLYIDEVKSDLKSKLEEGHGEMGKLGDNVKSLDDTIGQNFGLGADMKELMETVSREFERANGAIEGLKTEQDQSFATSHEQRTEARAAIIEDISAKLDEKFTALLQKFDDQIIVADNTAKTMEEKAAQQEELMNSSKAMSEELKLTIDTLGATVTELQTNVQEATTKMEEDSKTVFEHVEQTITKLDENHVDDKAEHALTRDELGKTMAAIEGVQNEITENHPQFLVSLKEILALVSQHYEHSQKQQEEAAERARSWQEQEVARAEELKSAFAGLPALLPPPPAPIEPVEKYDDTHVQEKLDRLIEHQTTALVETLEHQKEAQESQTTDQVQRLEEIQKTVMATSAQLAEFMSIQTQRITESHESKEREAEEAALLLERRLAQKEQIEAEITALNDQKESLRAGVEGLKSEHDALASQVSKLMAEERSLKTSLEFRREELKDMHAKADALESRMYENLMKHSRAMAAMKQAPAPKRNVSAMSNSTVGTLPGSNTMAMAIKNRPPIRRMNPAERRILSLNQITGNIPHGAAQLPNPSGLPGLKRSQSVKSNYVRKGSWNAAPRGEKENILDEGALSEVEEIDGSEAGTERRYSHATRTDTGSYVSDDHENSRLSYGTVPGESELSYGPPTGSELSYGTGSYLSGSDLDGTERRTSYGSTVNNLQNRDIDEDIPEEDEEEFEHSEHSENSHESEHDHEPEHEELASPGEVDQTVVLQHEHEHDGCPDAHAGADHKAMVVFGTDSGLGTEPPTAGEISDVDFFRGKGDHHDDSSMLE